VTGFRRFVGLSSLTVLVVSGLSAPAGRAEQPAPRGPATSSQVAVAAVSCPPASAGQATTVARQAPAPRPPRTAADAAEATFAAPDTPRRMIPGDEYRVPVTVRNTTTATLPKATYVLSYHWLLPDGDDATNSGNRLETELPADLAPGATVTVQARVEAPSLADIGNKRESFVLRWDLRDRQRGRWLSAGGAIQPLNQDVTVEDPTSDQLGLERFYQYAGTPTGAGSSVAVNQFSGNAVFSYSPFANPSRGLATFVGLAYNSQDTSDSLTGFGWSVSTSTLTRLGTPLDFSSSADFPDTVRLIDGDGTGHEFELNKHDSGDRTKWTYDSPAGVHLFLQRTTGADDSRRWVMTSPDRTQAFFDRQGNQTATVEKNGNELRFTYQQALVGGRSTKVLTSITDATGRRTLTLDYYQRGDSFSFYAGNKKQSGTALANTAIIDRLRSITDLSGRTITFTYSDRGLLQEVVDGAGGPEPKSFVFFYDDTQANRNTKLVRVVDPLGNGSTLQYFTDSGDSLRRWHVRTVTDRVTAATAFDYADPDSSRGSAIASTVTDGNGHAATYLLDGFGRPERLTNAKGETTTLVWDADNNVVRLREDNGALTTWVYDPKTGYPLEIRDAEANAKDFPPTRLGYRTALDGHVADLTEKTSPEGRRWLFGYDDRGNLVAVTDPKGTATPADGDFTSRYRYDELGHLVSTTDANGHTTTYADYDANGYPRRITDPIGCSSFFSYDAVGNVVSSVDAKQKVRTFTYDQFKRPLLTKVPKDAAANDFIVTPGPRYDRNDNVVVLTAANNAVTTVAYDQADRQVSITAPKDTPTGPTKTTTFAYDRVGNLIRETEPKGTLTRDNPNDFTTTSRYDQVDQLIEVTDATGQRATASYDNVGNLITEVDPRKTATADPNDVTTRYAYDLNHQPTRITDAAGNTIAAGYDRDGNTVQSTDEEGNTTLIRLDERAMPVEERVPHTGSGAEITYFTTRYEYDQVGNRTRTITPRGVETADDPDDFVQATSYDELNRVKEEILPFDRDDERITTPDRIAYGYDEVGLLREVSAPPSDGQSVRNVSRYTHFDNGWTRSSTDPLGISTNYDYNAVGEQTARTLVSAGGGSSRTMSWTYYPDGKRRTRSDDGVPVGQHVVLVDNSDPNDTEAVGDWQTLPGTGDVEGFDYRTSDPGSGADTFTWKAGIPASGSYQVFVRYAPGTATDARYTVEHNDGSTSRTVDQTQHAGEWVSLGTFAFTEGNTRNITLSDQANGTVVADAVRLVRDNSGDVDTEKKTFTESYDANDNLVSVADSTPAAPVDEYAISYDGLNRADKVEERRNGAVRNTTRYDYDPNGNLTGWQHDDQVASYTYDVRDLVSEVRNAKSTSDGSPKVSTFRYTARALIDRQVKPNGNTVDFGYFADGLLQHQVEKKESDGPVVNEHTIEYNPNGNRTKDTAHVQNADNHADSLDTVASYGYDPRDRVRSVTKTGDGDDTTETYVHDANDNVISQRIDEVRTTFRYDRNRLVSATSAGATSTYAYDPFGRLSKVSTAGQQSERYVYDGFDRTTEYRQGAGAATKTTRYAYDSLDRTISRTANATGTDPKTTVLEYLGLSEQVLTEREGGEVRKSYQYSPFGELLSLVNTKDNGDAENGYYSFNAHSDVESVTDDDGDNTSTYGYSAYGGNDPAAFTGADKPDPANPDAEPNNAYRFNTKRFDPASGSYDMGFRDYRPAENRYLSLDLYNGALADLSLTTNPFTMNRYAFGGGNPISMIEYDGHWPSWSDIGHAALDVAGLIPVVGEVADVANGIWYTAEGNYVDAALSFASAIPLAGYAATAVKAGKYGSDVIKAGAKYGDEGANAVGDATKAVPGGAATPSKAGAPATPNTPAAPSKATAPAPPAKAPAAPPTPKNACNSFTAATPVLMADGTTKAIEHVQVGDKVVATDPASGQTESEAVTAVIVGEGDKHLVQITIDIDSARGNATATVTATDGHPFWVDDEGRWVNAGDLATNDWVRTTDGNLLRVLATHTWTEHRRVHNLTVDGIHTYYVTAGTETLLVHNQGCPNLQPGNSPAARAGQGVHQDSAVRDAFDAIGYAPGRTLPSGKRPDFLTPGGDPVELKPLTRSGIRKGTRQLRGYMREMGTSYGELWVYGESNGLRTLQKYAVPGAGRRWNRLLGWPK